MLRRLLILLLLAAPAQAATKFYYGESPPDVLPTPAAAWDSIPTPIRWRVLVSGKDIDNLALNGIQWNRQVTDVSATAGDFTLGTVLIGPPMDDGIEFENGVTTVTAWSFMSEFASSDNVDRCIFGVRVVDSTGSVQSTLLAVDNYGATDELTTNTVTDGTSNAGEARRCANAQAVTSDYTTSSGDRLEVSFGFSVSVSGTTPQARIQQGRRNTTADCSVDLNTTGCVQFVEFSNTITYTTPTVHGSQWLYTDRFYVNYDQSQGGVTPTPDAAWENTASYHRRRLDPEWNGNQATGSALGIDLGEDSTDQYLAYQAISAPLAAGTEFTTSTAVWSMQSLAEFNGADEVNSCPIGIRILDADGSTINATLLAVAAHNWSGVEFTVSSDNSNSTGWACLDGTLLTANYTTQEGDRLVIEAGMAPAAVNTSPQARLWRGDGRGWRSDGSTTAQATEDCPLGLPVSLSGCIPWFQFSIDVPRLDDPNGPATRLYFPSGTSSDITPAVHASWSSSAELTRHSLSVTKGSTALANDDTADITAGDHGVFLQYISAEPMTPGTVFTRAHTTVTGHMMARQLAVSDNLMYFAMAIRVVTADGSSVQAELWPMDAYDLSYVKGATDAIEWNASASIERNEYLAGASTTMPGTSYETVAGDRLVIEIGAHSPVGSTTPQGVVLIGEDASDCPDDRSSTTECAAWVEFSNLIEFGGRSRNPVVIQ